MLWFRNQPLTKERSCERRDTNDMDGLRVRGVLFGEACDDGS
jgi:hypothetical protein